MVIRGQPVPTISQPSKMFLSPVATFTLARLTFGLGLCQEALHSSLHRLLRRIHQLKRGHQRVVGLLEVRQFLYSPLPEVHDHPQRHKGLPNYSVDNFPTVGSSPPRDKPYTITPKDTWARAMTLFRDPRFENLF